jgi:DNA-binding MarR family transcriptional regulator
LNEFFRFFWFEWVRSAAWRRLSSDVTGLPPSAGLILRQLDIEGPMSVSELARSLSLDSSTISRQVQPLRKAGYTLEQPRPTNRRIVELSLSAAGRGAAKELEQLQIGDWRAVLEGFPAKRRQELAVMLDELQSAMQAVIERSRA